MIIQINYILLLAILIVIILSLIIKYRTIKELNIKQSNKNSKLIKCDRLNIHDSIQHIINKNNILRAKDGELDWDIYLPCGYNYVEDEIENIIIRNKDQKVFAIKGCDKIASKNYLWKILVDNYGVNKASTIMPRTYIISYSKNNNGINEFKENYRKGQIYLLKKNIQQKKGILLSKSYEKLMTTINESKNVPNGYKVIQEYVDNLYLVKKRKINLRYYLLIICKKGVKKGYLYKYGKCIYSNKFHDIDMKNVTERQLNNETDMFLTSLNLDPKVYDTLPESFRDLEEYMGSHYYNILNTRVVNLFKDMMYAIESNICTRSNIYNNVSFQLFGADIIFDKHLKPFLLELNKGPSMKYITKNDEIMKKELIENIFKKVKIINNDNNVDSKFIELN